MFGFRWQTTKASGNQGECFNQHQTDRQTYTVCVSGGQVQFWLLGTKGSESVQKHYIDAAGTQRCIVCTWSWKVIPPLLTHIPRKLMSLLNIPPWQRCPASRNRGQKRRLSAMHCVHPASSERSTSDDARTACPTQAKKKKKTTLKSSAVE